MNHDFFPKRFFSHYKEKIIPWSSTAASPLCLSVYCFLCLEQPAHYPLPASRPTHVPYTFTIPCTWYMFADWINRLIMFSQPVNTNSIRFWKKSSGKIVWNWPRPNLTASYSELPLHSVSASAALFLEFLLVPLSWRLAKIGTFPGQSLLLVRTPATSLWLRNRDMLWSSPMRLRGHLLGAFLVCCLLVNSCGFLFLPL